MCNKNNCETNCESTNISLCKYLESKSKIVYPRKISIKQDFLKLAGGGGRGTNQGLQITGSVKCNDGFALTGSIYINPSGNYYDFTHELRYSPIFHDTTVIFIAKMSNQGKQIYFKLAGNTLSQSSGSSITTDEYDDSIYVTGDIYIDANSHYYDFNGIQRTDPHLYLCDAIFVARIKHDGFQTFFKTAGNYQLVGYGSSITVVKNSVYLTGSITTDLSGFFYDFDGVQQTNNTNLGGSNTFAIFAAKIKYDGHQEFFKLAGSAGADMSIIGGADIQPVKSNDDSDCGVYLTGSIELMGTQYYDFSSTTIPQTGQVADWDAIFVTRIKSDGEQIFFKLAGGNQSNGQNSGLSISAYNGGVTVTGYIQIPLPLYQYWDFNSSLQTNRSSFYTNSAIFVANLSENGHQTFFTIAGQLNGSSSGRSIVCLPDGIYTTGAITEISPTYPSPPTGSFYDFKQTTENLPPTQTPFLSDCSLIYVAKLRYDGKQVFFKISGSNSDNTTNPNTIGLSITSSIMPENLHNNFLKPEYDGVCITGSIAIDGDGSYYDLELKKHTSTLVGAYTTAAFIAKILTDGTQQFFKIAGSVNGISTGRSIIDIKAYTEDGGIFAVGSITTDSNGNYNDFDNIQRISPLRNTTEIFATKIENTAPISYQINGNL